MFVRARPPGRGHPSRLSSLRTTPHPDALERAAARLAAPVQPRQHDLGDREWPEQAGDGAGLQGSQQHLAVRRNRLLHAAWCVSATGYGGAVDWMDGRWIGEIVAYGPSDVLRRMVC